MVGNICEWFLGTIYSIPWEPTKRLHCFESAVVVGIRVGGRLRLCTMRLMRPSRIGERQIGVLQIQHI